MHLMWPTAPTQRSSCSCPLTSLTMLQGSCGTALLGPARASPLGWTCTYGSRYGKPLVHATLTSCPQCLHCTAHDGVTIGTLDRHHLHHGGHETVQAVQPAYGVAEKKSGSCLRDCCQGTHGTSVRFVHGANQLLPTYKHVLHALVVILTRPCMLRGQTRDTTHAPGHSTEHHPELTDMGHDTSSR